MRPPSRPLATPFAALVVACLLALPAARATAQDPDAAGRAQPRAPEPPGATTVGTVSLDDARRVIAAAEKKAREIGQPMNVAVVDAGGNLVAHARMDGAWVGSVAIAIDKAWTSRAFDISTQELAKESQPGGQFFGIHTTNDARVVVFAGGIPLKRAGTVVGAIGVSGGFADQDQAVAEAGAAAL